MEKAISGRDSRFGMGSDTGRDSRVGMGSGIGRDSPIGMGNIASFKPKQITSFNIFFFFVYELEKTRRP